MCLFGSGVVVKQGQLGHARNWSGNGRDEMTACVEVSPVSNPELEPLELFQIIIHYVEQHIRKRNLSKDWYTLQVTLNTKAKKVVSKVKATKMKSKYCALIGRTIWTLKPVKIKLTWIGWRKSLEKLQRKFESIVSTSICEGNGRQLHYPFHVPPQFDCCFGLCRLSWRCVDLTHIHTGFDFRSILEKQNFLLEVFV